MTNHEALLLLQQFESFKQVPLPQWAWLVERSEVKHLAEGEVYIKSGEPILHLVIVLQGRLEFRIEQNGNWRQVLTIEPGQVTGALPYSRLSDAKATGFCTKPTIALLFPKECFKEMICEHFELTQAFVSLMLDRTREFTENMQQQEKLVSLGKLSAGLAHELNNPASAIVRSASRLKRHLSETPESFKRIVLAQLKPEQVDSITALLFTLLEKRNQKPLSLLAKTQLEDELRDWFDEHHFVCSEENATSERVEIFADFQITTEILEKIASEVPESDLYTVLEWCEGMLNTEQYVSEIQEAASRIKNLVESVKGYSHMDMANDRELVHIRRGIESTLTMLSYKIKQKGIKVVQDYQENLNPIIGFEGELNQVWTNILDNAVDAVSEKGEIQIVCTNDEPFVKISIRDNGIGIPQEIISKVFDPFFTTKPIGKGTGLGLDIVKKIVSKHKGSIQVKSQKGKTEFEIRFPMKDDKQNG